MLWPSIQDHGRRRCIVVSNECVVAGHYHYSLKDYYTYVQHDSLFLACDRPLAG